MTAPELPGRDASHSPPARDLRRAICSDGVVLLRPLNATDLATHAGGCDDEVNRWSNGGRVSTHDEHLAWLERNAAAWRDQGPVVDLAVERVDDGTHVGVVGIQRGLDYLSPGEVNLTYALYAGHRGQGLASRGVQLAMQVARAQTSVSAFIIRCDRANHRSGALARRLGFTFVGRIREHEEYLDRYRLLCSARGQPAPSWPDRSPEGHPGEPGVTGAGRRRIFHAAQRPTMMTVLHLKFAAATDLPGTPRRLANAAST